MLSDSELIEKLGGCSAVAVIFGIKPPSVSGWIQNNRIPRDRRIMLAVVAEDRSITTRKELFPDSYVDIWIDLRPKNISVELTGDAA